MGKYVVFIMAFLFANPTSPGAEIRRIDKIEKRTPTGNTITRHFLYNPVGFWKFDEESGTSVTDSSGMGNSGTISGATRVTGRIGGGLSFDGNDFITKSSPSSALKPSQWVAVAAWIKTSATDTAGGEIASMGDSYALKVSNLGYAQFFYYDGAEWRNVVSTGTSVRNGVWRHIVGQKTSTGLQLYIDGVYGTSTTHTGTITYTLGTNFLIGKHGDGGTTSDFNGVIDDVRIFDRALTADEIKRLYFLGQP